ncbi:MAG: T9SS type A sorting domain-containing protein [Cyclobacteriaceae bacterium]
MKKVYLLIVFFNLISLLDIQAQGVLNITHPMEGSFYKGEVRIVASCGDKCDSIRVSVSYNDFYWQSDYYSFGNQVDTTILLSSAGIYDLRITAYGDFGIESKSFYDLLHGLYNPNIKKVASFDDAIVHVENNKVVTKGTDQINIIDLETMERKEIRIEEVENLSLVNIKIIPHGLVYTLGESGVDPKLFLYQDNKITQLEGSTGNFAVSGDNVIWFSNGQTLNRKNIISNSLEVVQLENQVSYNLNYPIEPINEKGEVTFYTSTKDIYLFDSVGNISKINQTMDAYYPVANSNGVYYSNYDGTKFFHNDLNEEKLLFEGNLDSSSNYKAKGNYVAIQPIDSNNHKQIAVIDSLGELNTVSKLDTDTELIGLSANGGTLFSTHRAINSWYLLDDLYLSYENYSVRKMAVFNTSIVTTNYYQDSNEWQMTNSNTLYKLDTTETVYSLEALSKTIKEDEQLNLSQYDFLISSEEETFIYNFRIDSVPKLGNLYYYKQPYHAKDRLQKILVTKGYTLKTSDLFTGGTLKNFKYEPYPGVSGVDIFYWNADIGYGFKDINQTATIEIIPENNPPRFSVSDLVRNEDFVGAQSNAIVIHDIPIDEQSQEITFSISPSSIDFAEMKLNPKTGIVNIYPILNAFGTQELVITADDGQPKNNLYSRTFSITVLPVNDEPIAHITTDTMMVLNETISLNLLVEDVDLWEYPTLETITVNLTSENESIIENQDIVIEEEIKSERFKINIKSSGKATGLCPMILEVSDYHSTTREFIFIEVVKSLSNPKLSTSEVNVYPIPTSSELNIEINQKDNYTIEFFDLSGAKISSIEKKNTQFLKLNLDAFNSGTYILKIRNNGQYISTSKIIVSR